VISYELICFFIKAQVLLQEQVLNKMQAIVDIHIAIVVNEID